jgi:hypothetical protein
MYKKIINNEALKICRKIWTGWGSGRQVNPIKCKAVRFTRARVKELLNYTLGIKSGSKQLQILGNNLAQRLKMV